MRNRFGLRRHQPPLSHGASACREESGGSRRRSPNTTLAITLLLFVVACHPQDDETAHELTGGDPRAGKAAIARYGCGGCHEIPGVDNASGLVGPSLAKIADRTTLAGQLPNHPDNMIKWIQDPQGAAPGTLMPNMNVTDRDARDIAAYLYTLRMDR